MVGVKGGRAGSGRNWFVGGVCGIGNGWFGRIGFWIGVSLTIIRLTRL